MATDEIGASWFETREDALLTMRARYTAAAAVTTSASSASRLAWVR